MKPFFFGALLFVSLVTLAFAGSATWNLNPTSGDWNTVNNWTPATVPNGPNDIATFRVSTVTDISFSADTEVNGIVFDQGASAFTISPTPFGSTLVLSGGGITNNSGIAQTFALLPTFTGPGLIQFGGSATAGRKTFFVSNGVASGPAPEIDFIDSSSAGSAAFTNNGALASGLPGCLISFSGNSTAARAMITNNGATVAGAEGGITRFTDTSFAGNATLIANGGSNGGDGGLIQFSDSADGVSARIKLSGNGTLDTTNVTDRNGTTIGSLEGDGNVLLGTRGLTIGTNNRSTEFSGLIQGSASITKEGSGTLTLTGANIYSGITYVNQGVLKVGNQTSSATGTGFVVIYSGGTLAGGGIVGGNVSVSGGVLAPGTGATTLKIRRVLSITGASTYLWKVKTTSARADKVVAKGVIIVPGAFFSGLAIGDAVLPPGTTFTAIDNTSTDPISGIFAGLPDGGTTTIGNNTFQVNYEGGDGNDFTLTVVE